MNQADFIIIGSGSAGSALAYRLSEDGKHTVIVLEFGGSDIGPFVQMPSALAYPMNMERYNWGYMTEPEPHLNGRRLNCPRGSGKIKESKGGLVLRVCCSSCLYIRKAANPSASAAK